MADEQALQHWAPGHAGTMAKSQNVEVFLKRHGLNIKQYVPGLARSMSETITFYNDCGIDTDAIDTATGIGLNVLNVQESVTEMPAPGNPTVLAVNNTPQILEESYRFTKFDSDVTILGAQYTLAITALSTAMTDPEAGLDAEFLMAAIGKVLATAGRSFKSKTYKTQRKFHIPLTETPVGDNPYKFLGMSEGADPASPNVVTFNFSRFEPAAGPTDYTAHMIDILTPTPAEGVHNDYEVDQVAEFGTAGAAEQDALFGQLVAGTSAYLLSRTRTLDVEGPAVENIDVVVFPTGDPATDLQE